MFVQPLSSVIVPVSPEKKQVSNLDQTAVTNHTLARVNMTIVLSADTAWPRHALCVPLFMWEDAV